MERHTGFKHGAVTGAKAHGTLAPVRWIGQSNRIATATVLVDAVFLQHAKEGNGNFFADITRFGGFKPGLKPFDQGAFSIKESLFALSQIDGA